MSHPGEEPCLSGWAGSGTLNTTWCNLSCAFCQNWEINIRDRGHQMTADAIARAVQQQQATGCHNVNWVTPTHRVSFLVEALVRAWGRGLTQPPACDCGNLVSPEALPRSPAWRTSTFGTSSPGTARGRSATRRLRDTPEAARAALLLWAHDHRGPRFHIQMLDLARVRRGMSQSLLDTVHIESLSHQLRLLACSML